jgi:SAM-dependent methyltransferase
VVNESTDRRPRARACPVCGHSSAQLLYRQEFEAFSEGCIGNGYDVVACVACGACFASGLPGQARFGEYYAAASKYDLGAVGARLSSQDETRFASLAAFVGEHVQDTSSAVLDVGTAVGGFLGALRGVGFTCLRGVDPSPDAVRVAREANGLEVVVGDLETSSLRVERFRLISFCAVFEHLLDPGAAARSAKWLLAPDGMLLIQLPDAQRFAEHVDAPYQQFSVEHINYFTGRSLRNLMATQGFVPVAERSVDYALSADADMAVFEGLYRRAEGEAGEVVPDIGGAGAVQAYCGLCAEKEAAIERRLAALAREQRPIYVWGAGTHTLHLLRSSPLGECSIAAFIDSNPHYAGSILAGRSVLRPQDLPAADLPILISSAVSQTVISTAARELFGDDIDLILLY